MPIREAIQNAMKEAMKNRDSVRLETLRMAKGALLMKEKESPKEVTDDVAVSILRSEVRKRQQSVEIFRELGKEEAAVASEAEIRVIEEFLPRQLSEAAVEEKVRAYLGEHPEIDHAGKLTGALKKELGDSVDGKLLNVVCQRVLSRA